MHAERRQSPRVRPDPGIVCTCTGAGFPGGHNLATRLLDVSASGACIVTVGRLRERIPVLVDIQGPQATSRVKARAVVCWSQTLERRGRTAHVAGLYFDRGCRGPVPERPAEPQRRFKRFTPRVAHVSLEPRGLARLLGIRRDVALRLKDLSQGGAQVACSKRLKAGLRVDFRVEAPAARDAIVAEAQVRWCRRDTRSLEPRWDAGLVFKWMSPADEERLRALDRFHVG
jgi:c-di-GMP-binding flagellar brake protein YcgR